MEKQALRDQLDELKRAINVNEDEHQYLVGMVQNLEGLLRVRGWANGVQPELVSQAPGRGGAPKGAISFRKGLLKVLREARGVPLADVEVWDRMIGAGVVSDSRNPLNFVNMTARKSDEIEEVLTKVYKWKTK